MPPTKTRHPKRKALVLPEAAVGDLMDRKKRANGTPDNISHQNLRFVDELDDEFLERHKRALAKMGEHAKIKKNQPLPPPPPVDMERHHRALAKMQASENSHIAAQKKSADAAAAHKAKQQASSAQETTTTGQSKNGSNLAYQQKVPLPPLPQHQFDLERHKRAVAKAYGTAASDPDTAAGGGPATKKKRPAKTNNQQLHIPNTNVTLEQHRRALAKMNEVKPKKTKKPEASATPGNQQKQQQQQQQQQQLETQRTVQEQQVADAIAQGVDPERHQRAFAKVAFSQPKPKAPALRQQAAAAVARGIDPGSHQRALAKVAASEAEQKPSPKPRRFNKNNPDLVTCVERVAQAVEHPTHDDWAVMQQTQPDMDIHLQHIAYHVIKKHTKCDRARNAYEAELVFLDASGRRQYANYRKMTKCRMLKKHTASAKAIRVYSKTKVEELVDAMDSMTDLYGRVADGHEDRVEMILSSFVDRFGYKLTPKSAEEMAAVPREDGVVISDVAAKHLEEEEEEEAK